MKTFLNFINEVHVNDIKKNDRMLSDVGHKISAKNAEPELGKKAFTYNGQDIHVQKDRLGNRYTVRHPESGKIVGQIVTLRMGKDKKSGHKIDTATASGLKGSMDGLYHHLLKKGAEGHEHGLTSIVGDNQSEGAKKVWTKLSAKPGITVHGWHKDKAINLGKKIDTDETHVSSSDYKNTNKKEKKDLEDIENMKIVASYHKPKIK